MIILDACVLIAHFNAQDAHHDRATKLLLDSASREFVASPITVAEVLVGPARVGMLESAEAALRRLDIRTVSLPEDAPARLAALRAETNLKLPDCCILLAAEQTGGDIATLDDRLTIVARRKGVNVLS